MKVNFDSIRNQLLFSFLFFSFLFIIATAVSLAFVRRGEVIRNFRSDLSKFNYHITEQLRNELYFLLKEKNDSKYHLHGNSEALLLYQEEVVQVKHSFRSLCNHQQLASFHLREELDSVRSLLVNHTAIFDSILIYSRKRGFKDYGLIGKMRKSIHQLENNPRDIKMAEILSLRRHEKDFLLRRDSQYVQKLNLLGDSLLNRLNQSPDKNKEQIQLLNKYLAHFNELVLVNAKLGDFNEGGWFLKLQKSINQIENNLENMRIIAKQSEDRQIKKVNYLFIVSVVFFIVLSIVLSYYLAKWRSQPITQLARAFKNIKLNGKFEELKVDLSNPSRELKILFQSFSDLLSRLGNQFREIEEKTATLEKQNEELIKVNAELDKFVYSVSHDLRAPLASLLGLITLFKNETDPKEIKDNLRLQELCVKKLDFFIHDIIDLSRNSRLDVREHQIDFEVLINEIIDNQRFAEVNQETEKKIEIVQLEEFKSDYQRIYVILNNLITNAFRYSDQRKEKPYIKVYVRVDFDQVDISVEDNGIGIRPEHLGKIFNMFYRGTDLKSGSGLGLYITMETIKKLNGNIEVESVYGEGTIFKVRLPNLVKKKQPTLNLSLEE